LLVETPLPAAVAFLPTEAAGTIDPEERPVVEPPTIEAISEADKEPIDEVTVIEEPPAFIEEQLAFPGLYRELVRSSVVKLGK